MESWDIKGTTLEFDEETHTYIADGIIVPSVTQIMQVKFGGKYNAVNRDVLQRAAERGTAIHRAIENLCKQEQYTEYKEVRNFLFLKKRYKFNVTSNEIPIIIFDGYTPIFAGRVDLILQDYDGRFGIGDIKTTSVLDKHYLAYQLNMYRIGVQQSYDTTIDFLKGIHLKDDTRKYVDIPINEELSNEIIREYYKEQVNE